MHQLEDIEVSAMRVQQTTLSTAVVKTDELNRDNTGQNLPYLLTTTPGLQVTSDDGLGVGYTYFRVRGTDHTRINMTVNEVPLNDQESQTVFWVNMTDMSSSISQVDVQRGVGTSTSGSAFGASLNMQTNMLDSVSRLTLAFNGGMYNTFREMVQAHASISNRWKMNARFTKVNSDGFLYRTKSDLYSYYGDIGWYGKKTQVILRAFGGAESTGMGWEGVSYETAYGINGADRRYNPAGEYTVPASDGSDSTVYYKNQTDNYAQQHAQLTINHRFTPQWSLSATFAPCSTVGSVPTARKSPMVKPLSRRTRRSWPTRTGSQLRRSASKKFSRNTMSFSKRGRRLVSSGRPPRATEGAFSCFCIIDEIA